MEARPIMLYGVVPVVMMTFSIVQFVYGDYQIAVLALLLEIVALIAMLAFDLTTGNGLVFLQQNVVQNISKSEAEGREH